MKQKGPLPDNRAAGLGQKHRITRKPRERSVPTQPGTRLPTALWPDAYNSEATQGMLRPPLVIPGAHHSVRDMMRGIWRGECSGPKPLVLWSEEAEAEPHAYCHMGPLAVET